MKRQVSDGELYYEHRKNNWRGRKAYARRNMTEKIGGKI